MDIIYITTLITLSLITNKKFETKSQISTEKFFFFLNISTLLHRLVFIQNIQI